MISWLPSKAPPTIAEFHLCHKGIETNFDQVNNPEDTTMENFDFQKAFAPMED